MLRKILLLTPGRRWIMMAVIMCNCLIINAQWIYSITDKNGSPVLQRINLITYEVIDIVSLWPRDYSDIAFDSSGRLYGVDNESIDEIYEIDTLTGFSTLVYTFTDDFDAVGMTIDHLGVFYLAGSYFDDVPELKSLNLSTGITQTITRIENGYNSINDCVFYEGELYCCALSEQPVQERAVLLKIDTSGNELHQEVFRYEKWSGHALASISTICEGQYLVSPVSELLNFFNFADTTINSVSIFTTPWVFQSGGASSLTSWMGSIPPLRIDTIIFQGDPCLASSTIIATPKKGRQGIQYSLDNGPYQSDSIFYNIGNGLHFISIQDDKGCLFTTDQFEIQKPRLDTFFIPNVIAATCGENNGQISVTDNLGSANTLFSLDGNNWQSDTLFQGLAGGSYNVHIMIGTDCTDTIQAFIPAWSNLDVSIDVYPEHCEMADGYFNIITTGGQPPYQFHLSNGQNSNLPSFDSLSSGDYILTIIDFGGCSTQEIIVLPNSNSKIDSIIVQDEICGTANGSVNIIIEGSNAPYFYSIDSGPLQDSASFLGLKGGTHILQVTDVYGCTLDSALTILNIENAPIYTLDLTNASCNEDNGIIVVNPDSIEDLVSINFGPFSNIQKFEHLSGGSYSVTILNNQGCKDTSSVNIAQTGSPEIINLDISPEHCGLQDGTIEVMETTGGLNPYQYSLDNAPFAIGSKFDDVTTGVHSIIVKDSVGCLDTVLIEVENVAGPQILDSVIKSATCNSDNGEILIHTLPSDDLMFRINDITYSNGQFLNLVAGHYIITIFDEYGCSSSVDVTVPTENILSVESIDVKPGTCNLPTGGFTVTGDEDIFITIDEIPNQSWTSSITGLEHGTYHLSLSNQEGCQIDTVITIPSNCNVSFPNAFSPNGDNINDLFKAYSELGFVEWNMEIFDRSGNLVYSSSDPTSGWDGTFNGKECQVGVYVWKLRYRNSIENKAILLTGDITLVR